MKRLFPVVCLSCLIAAHSFAGSATWNLNASRDWNTSSNWTPATVPNGPQDTATFGVSQQTIITQLISSELNGMVFNPGVSSHEAPGVAIGSLEGDGIVTMGALNLTVGSNSLSSSFSGSLSGSPGSSLTKVGTGTLTLSGANNTYTDGTTIVSGSLKVNNTSGSGTGSGAVQVNGGILGGKGIIAGTVTIGTGSGTGAFLQPGVGASTPATLTIQQGLTWNADGAYLWKLNTKKGKADQVIANGVTIQAGGQFNFKTVGNKKLTGGKVFTAISNTASTPISGIFANLADGSTLTVGNNTLQASYSGGDGNDLTLTVVR